MCIKVKRIRYFIELHDGTNRIISEKEYNRQKEYYARKSWDFDEFSKNFVNTELYVQYDNCITYYDRDFSVTIGYTQREVY